LEGFLLRGYLRLKRQVRAVWSREQRKRVPMRGMDVNINV
jgi:hypothetical protein